MSLLPMQMTQAIVKRRGKILLGPVDFTMTRAGITIVLGPNGAGKTTFLRALHGLDRLSGGNITWQLPLEQARLRQSFVFQTPIMLRRTVRDNLAYPLMIKGVAKQAALAQATEWASKVGLGDVLEQQAPQLSGGEKQKLALARALITAPELLFLDEPCASLDGRSTREIEAILHDAAKAGTRIIMATHDLGQARRLASDIVFMMHGQIIEQQAANVFFSKPNTPQAAALLQGNIVE